MGLREGVNQGKGEGLAGSHVQLVGVSGGGIELI